MPSARLRWFSGIASVLGWGSLIVALAMALIWIAIYVLIVPRIGEFRPLLESRLSSALGVPVRIGAISARVHGLMPTFEMAQVRLLDKQGRDALVLKTITAAVSPQSLLELGFEQLLIDQPELVIRRHQDGRISVAGLDTSPVGASPSDENVQADWLFSQNEIVIRSGTLHWHDETRQAPPLALTQVDLFLRNQGRKHLMRIDATPPPGWGSRFTVAGDFRGPLLSQRPGDWRQWRGQLHADLPMVDVKQLRQHTHLGVDIDEGRGAVRGWATLNQGTVNETTVDVALADVNIRLREDLQPLSMSTLSGRFSLRLDESDLALSTENLNFELREGSRWPGGNIRLTLTDRNDDARRRGEFVANQLDLAAIAQVSDRLPLDARAHRLLRELQPRGTVPNLSAKWSGALEQPSSYEVQGEVQSIHLLSSSTEAKDSSSATSTASVSIWHPGINNAQINFKFNNKGGTAQLQIAQGSITLPGIFEQPTVHFDEFSSDLAWQITDDQIQLRLPSFKFANSDAQGEGKAHWHTADPTKSASKSRFPGVLDLQGNLTRADGNKVHRYLPLTIAPPARQYVREAVREGKASLGRFKVKGDLWDMPFTDPNKGEFFIAAQVSGAVLDYVPRSMLTPGSLPWPALTQINGELIFDRQSLAVRGASARIAGAPGVALSKVDAVIPDLTQNAQVAVSADARGNAGEILAVVNGSPLLFISNKALAQASVNGTADLKMRMLVPINQIDTSRVQATVTLPGNDFQFSPGSPTLRQARGQITISETGFSLRDVSARAFGGDLRIEGGSRLITSTNDVSVALRGQGFATADGLRQTKELGMVSRLAAQASGGAAYTANLNIRRGVPEVFVSSNLQGLGLQLPQPLSKTTESVMAVRYENSLVREPLGDSNKRHDQIRFEVASIGEVNYLRDISGDVPRVIRGRIGVGLAPGDAITGADDDVVAANINFTQINMDAWERLLSDASRAANPSASVTTSTGLSAETLAYLPTVVSVRARELTLQGRTLNNVVLGGSRDGLTWRANIDARELNGYLEYRQPSSNSLGRVYARLARLSLAAATASDIEAALDQQPSSIPALDVVVEDLELLGKRLGRMELEALNREVSGIREWRLTRLNVNLPEAQFSANGNWALIGANQTAQRGNRRRTALSFKLDITNAGELLKRFGQDKVIARGNGAMQGQIAWLGAPWALDYASLSGGFSLNVESGQFLKSDPGLAKLLGVLSLQSLPRRLALDFRDVFSEGFAFDVIRGDVKIDQGIASTNNLQMKGVSAAALMEGTANIHRETQDIKVVVVPELNAGTASLVATAINPAIGIGTFLAQLILRRPVIEAATQEFHITGSWADPQIERVKRVKAPSAATPEVNKP